MCMGAFDGLPLSYKGDCILFPDFVIVSPNMDSGNGCWWNK